MKKPFLIALAITVFCSFSAFAESYNLVAESHCSDSDKEFSFSCEAGASFTVKSFIIFKKDGKWYGQETLKTLKGDKGDVNLFPLELIKQDENVLAFNYPVSYSGIANIVLIKSTGNYYFSELSYSSVLDVQDVTIEFGSFSLGK